MAEPHPQNVPGPFYVENGCCITCGVPSEIAPDMFGWAEGDAHCFVSRQPCDPGQLDRMLEAMWSSEVDCVRYRGNDPAIARRIAEFGNKDSCDFPVAGARIRIRDQVQFRSPTKGDTPLAVAARFRAWLDSSEGLMGASYRVRKPRWWNRQTVIYTWEMNARRFPAYNHVRFGDEGDGPLRAYLRSGRFMAGHGLALHVHEWLKDVDRASDICWLSKEERRKGAPGFHMPI